MMKFYMQHKNKSKSIEGFDNALKMGLVASTGRGLKGHGHKVFVYGTLMKGNSNYESFLGDAEFVGGVIPIFITKMFQGKLRLAMKTNLGDL